jgi:hypothetical protein
MEIYVDFGIEYFLDALLEDCFELLLHPIGFFGLCEDVPIDSKFAGIKRGFPLQNFIC